MCYPIRSRESLLSLAGRLAVDRAEKKGRHRIGAAPIRTCNFYYSCAGNGSIVFTSTGTCTSSLQGVVIMNTRMTGKASMKLK